MRPSGFALFLDGQWVLQDLRWSGWGSSVARATGISNSDNDIPNVGKVTLCAVPQSSLGTEGGCAQNWDASPPVLMVGQEIRAGNVLCKSLRSGITCTIASGRQKGKGFMINTKVVRGLR